jgi:hypothetical protein
MTLENFKQTLRNGESYYLYLEIITPAGKELFPFTEEGVSIASELWKEVGEKCLQGSFPYSCGIIGKNEEEDSSRYFITKLCLSRVLFYRYKNFLYPKNN